MEATSAPRPHGVRIARPRRLLAAYSDERLVEHVRRGDEAAFEVLYDRHASGILGFCRHMLGSAADAEDAVQHTFMAAHADIERNGRRDLHVKAWLFTIARNRCLSLLRARREQPTDDVIELSTDHLLHDVEQREDIRALLADIAKLPGDQREALVLAEVGDLSHADISEVLGCEVGKVKSLVYQARSALIDRRAAREASCDQIREQLATLRGGALRRSEIRNHLEVCPGCSEYREEIRRQRAMLAVALPVVPTAALRANVLGSAGLGGSSAAAGAGAAGAGAGATTGATGLAGVVAQGGLAKVGVAVALAATGAGGAAVAHNGGLPLVHHSTATEHVAPGMPAGNNTAHTGAAFSGESAVKSLPGAATGSKRSANGTAHGFTPTKGQSNGAAARRFAATRGAGKHTGTVNKHHNAATQLRTKPDHVKHVATPQRGPTNPPAKAHTRTAPTNTAPTHTQPTPVAKGRTTPAPTTTTPAPEATVAPVATTTTPTTTTRTNASRPLGGTKKTADGVSTG